MYTVIWRYDRNRYELVVGDPKTLFEILGVFQESTRVTEYKVINSDAGVIKDFEVAFGWWNGYFTKNAFDGFTW